MPAPLPLDPGASLKLTLLMLLSAPPPVVLPLIVLSARDVTEPPR